MMLMMWAYLHSQRMIEKSGLLRLSCYVTTNKTHTSHSGLVVSAFAAHDSGQVSIISSRPVWGLGPGLRSLAKSSSSAPSSMS